jgi:hydroxypyruvate reductase
MDLRKQAIDLFWTGVAAAEPGAAVVAALEQNFDRLEKARRVTVIAFGKAACAMTGAALPLIGSKLHKAVALPAPMSRTCRYC